MKPARVLLVFLAIVLFSLDMTAQCAMCKEAAETSMKDNPTSMARSLNKGILYLMAVPYLMVAFIFRRQLAVLFKKFFSRFSRNGKVKQAR